MTNENQAMEIIQDRFYTEMNNGNMRKLAEIFHDDATFIHTQVWEHGEFTRDNRGTKIYNGKQEITDHFVEQGDGLRKHEPQHHVTDLIVDGQTCAYLCDIDAPEEHLQIVGWFEIENGKIIKLIVSPAKTN